MYTVTAVHPAISKRLIKQLIQVIVQIKEKPKASAELDIPKFRSSSNEDVDQSLWPFRFLAADASCSKDPFVLKSLLFGCLQRNPCSLVFVFQQSGWSNLSGVTSVESLDGDLLAWSSRIARTLAESISHHSLTNHCLSWPLHSFAILLIVADH